MKLVAPAIESRTLPTALDEDSALFFSRALGVARRQYLDKLYTHMQEFVELKSYSQPTQARADYVYQYMRLPGRDVEAIYFTLVESGLWGRQRFGY